MKLTHHSRDARFRQPMGAQPCGQAIRLRLLVEGDCPQSVQLRVWFGKESFLPMRPVTACPGLYEASLTLPESPCLLWYDFQVVAGGQFYWYGNAEDRLGGEGALIWGEARSYQITVYDPAYETPAYTKEAVFYQVFPDRFRRDEGAPPPILAEDQHFHEDWQDSPSLMADESTGDYVAHDFFGGTLRGIQEKLPYLSSLGVTGLYLNPIFKAHTNHRFDTMDWHRIDPLLGTEEDFKSLCQTAAGHGIRILLDGVFNHSGNHSPFFQDAMTNKDSPYRNWFLFEHWPDMYKCWWGFTTLPDLNKHLPAVLDYFLLNKDAVVTKWPKLGAAGWRIDVADELPMAYLATMRRQVKAEKPDALIIGEVWEDASNKFTYGQMRSYCLGDTLDSVMNYPLRDAAIAFLMGEIPAQTFIRRMEALYENYPPAFAAALLNILGSHDRPRILNVLAGQPGDQMTRKEQQALRLTDTQRALGKKRLLLLLHLIIAMPGMPCVYYGDEAGMEGATDPFCRGTFPWGQADEALTDAFRKALARKRKWPALQEGALSLKALDEDVLLITRETAGQRAYTAINRGNRTCKVRIAGRDITLAAYGSHMESTRF